MNADQRALGERVLEYLTQHPEQHDQGVFGHRTQCGTTACIAGWTILFAEPLGVTIEWTPALASEQWAMSSVRMPNGDLLSPGQAGEKLLGLDPVEALKLFYVADSNQGARAVLREILDAAPVPS